MSRRIEQNNHGRFPIVLGLTLDLFPDKPGADVALVTLPGAWMHAQDSRICGFLEAMRDRGLSVGILMINADQDDYMPATDVRRLRKEVVDPLRALGYQRI